MKEKFAGIFMNEFQAMEGNFEDVEELMIGKDMEI
jgi:hypothetical protein